MQIKIETPGSDAYAELNARLVQFNRESAPWAREAFTVAAYGDDGVLIGGAHGVVNMGLVEVRGLYEKLGYVVFGTLDYPHRAERYYMRKDL